ncbi:hypothetical protein AYK24_08350 [Thermoplasmatales archaeon SG8-52-4]|nr:MAG: hypothetical protein AYK24_08350 [Thermoplasmatales archaeon SG8-52-4]
MINKFIGLFAVLFIFTLVVAPGVSALSEIVYSDSSDGHIKYHDGAYDSVADTSTNLRIGQNYASGYNWYRGYMEFDTTDYDQVTKAYLNVYFTDTETDNVTDCDVEVLSIAPFGTIDLTDWSLSGDTIISNLTNINDSKGQWYQLDVTDYINESGLTAFQFKSYESTGTQVCMFKYATQESATDPYLQVFLYGADMPNFNVTHPDSRLVYGEDSCGFLLPSTQPHDPKIACEPDGDSCVAIFYENQPLCSVGLKYSVSFDGFETIEYHGVVRATTLSDTVYIDPMDERGTELHYDIVYDDYLDHYFIAFERYIYVIPTFDPGVFGVSPYRVTDGYNIVGGSIGDDLSVDCAIENNWKGGGYACIGSNRNYHILGFEDGNGTNLALAYSCQMTSGVDWDGATWLVTYDPTNQTETANGNLYDCAEIDSTSSCSSGGSYGWDYYSGFGVWSGSEWKYSIEGQIDYCPGTLNNPIDEDNLGSPNDDFNMMFFGGNFYYNNETTFLVYTAESSDLTTFSTPELQYTMNEGINEFINQSDAGIGGTANYYIWKRSSDLTDGTDGIYVQEQTTYPVVLSSNQDVFATLTCDSEDYTTSDSGSIMQLFTPCLTGNELQIVSDKSPQVDSIDINFNTCESISVYSYYPENPYDFTFTVKDALTNDVLDGATFSLTEESDQTTNANGQATFNINAISNPNLKESRTGCKIDVSTDGTPKTFYGEVELSGYVDNTFIMTPAKLSIGDINTWEFENNKLVTMYPDGVVLDVHVYTSDGYEVYVSNYNISVTGNNDDTFTFSDGNPTRRNWNRNTPATFLLYDNRSSYNITIGLVYPQGTDSLIMEVETNTQYDAYFYLPYTLLDLPCTSISDCVPDFCSDDGYHHELTGCVEEQCEYTTTDCFSQDLCDILTGCFAFDTESQCTNDIQCMNDENVSYCIDLGSMYVGQCGDDGYCKQTEKICTTFCNETVGYCNEKALCRNPQHEQVGYEYSGGSVYTDAYCTFENAGMDQCLQMGRIPKSELEFLGITIQDVLFSHEGFGLFDIGDYYKVSDLSVQCSDSCVMTLDFCSSGECSATTGRCLTEETSTEWSAMIWGAWVWISGIIPIELRMFAWLLFTILVMVWYSQSKHHSKGWGGGWSSDNNTDTIVVGVLMFFAGIGVGFIHWIFMLIIGVIVSLLIWLKIGQ